MRSGISMIAGMREKSRRSRRPNFTFFKAILPRQNRFSGWAYGPSAKAKTDRKRGVFPPEAKREDNTRPF
jgi:hypothetical protein